MFGDGSQTRSFCYVSDLIKGLASLAASGYHQPVNIGNPSEMSLLGLAETVIEVTGSRSEIVYEALPEDDPRVRQPTSRWPTTCSAGPRGRAQEGLKRTIEEAGVERLVGAQRPACSSHSFCDLLELGQWPANSATSRRSAPRSARSVGGDRRHAGSRHGRPRGSRHPDLLAEILDPLQCGHVFELSFLANTRFIWPAG